VLHAGFTRPDGPPRRAQAREAPFGGPRCHGWCGLVVRGPLWKLGFILVVPQVKGN